jgi:hypothetical protein
MKAAFICVLPPKCEADGDERLDGQTEGQNTRLKLIKRQMYERAKLDLLRARLFGTT